MPDIASTILAGTSQMADAASGLVRIRAVNRARKQAAIQAASESLKEVGDTLKEYGSYRQAKQAEDEVRQVDDAYSLGASTKGASGALTALTAVRPTTAAAARRRVELVTQAQAQVAKQNSYALDEAQAHHLRTIDEEAKQKQQDAQDERDARKSILSEDTSWAQTPEDRQALQLFAAGSITPANFLSYRKQVQEQAKFNAKQAADAAKAASIEAGKNARAAASEKTKQEIASARNATTLDVTNLNNAARASVVQSQLDAAKTNAENAIAARARSDAMRDSWEQQRIAILQNDSLRRWTFGKLQAKQKQLTLDRITALANGWNQGESKDDLLKAIDAEKSDVDGMLEDISTYEKIAPAPVAAPAAQAAPAPAADPFLDAMPPEAKADFLKLPAEEQAKVRAAMSGK